ncbi:hypothetical protein [Sulfuricella sp.]|uniref:hypothetical protein n=1 Tax=Sulfuricella sp. TaxID=2099377 RepID=UPI002C5AA9C3|nr:hypothetical protein [Sulfuricella sp.]HUX63868.1 hypothetical protein [Sulfuricella sp.]
MTWDTLNNDWNQWMLGSTGRNGYDLLSRPGFEMASWKELAAGLGGWRWAHQQSAELYIALRYAPDPNTADLRQFRKRGKSLQAQPD